jgi:hypothetical protein
VTLQQQIERCGHGEQSEDGEQGDLHGCCGYVVYFLRFGSVLIVTVECSWKDQP